MHMGAFILHQDSDCSHQIQPVKASLARPGLWRFKDYTREAFEVLIRLIIATFGGMELSKFERNLHNQTPLERLIALPAYRLIALQYCQNCYGTYKTRHCNLVNCGLDYSPLLTMITCFDHRLLFCSHKLQLINALPECPELPNTKLQKILFVSYE